MNLIVYEKISILLNHFIYHKCKILNKLNFIFIFISIRSPRYSVDNEVYEMNAMVGDIEQVLNKIAQRLKQVNLYFSFDFS